MKKTFLIISAQFLPHMGGVEKYTYKVAKNLVERGNKVIIFSSQYCDEKLEEKIEGIVIYRFPVWNLIDGRFPLLKNGFQFYKKFCEVIEENQIDLVIINTRFYMISLLSAFVCHKKRMRTMLIEHGSSHLVLGNKIISKAVECYEHIVTFIIKRKVKEFYGVSKAACDWLEHYNIKAKGVLHNCIDLEEIDSMKETYHLTEKYQLPEDSQFVTFTGRLVKEKGILELAKAIKILRNKYENLHLVVAGEGNLQQNLVNQEGIIFLGRVNLETVISVLRETDYFCLPSKSEGLPTSVLEAIVCDCFIICTKKGGCKELILDDTYGLLLPDNSVNSIVDAIEYAINHKSECLEAKRKCFNHVLQQFTWDKTVDTIEKLVN